MRPHRAIVFSTFSVLALTACDPIVHLGGVFGGASGSSGLGGGAGGAGGDSGGAGGTGASGVLWRATFEPGDLSEWNGDGNGGVFVANITTRPSVTTDFAHTGRYAGKADIKPSNMASLQYFFRDAPSPAEAYYSAWFYIPGTFTVKGNWLSLVHFQDSDGKNAIPTWDVNLNPQTDGSLTAQLYNYVTAKPVFQAQPVPVPIAKWVHFELLMKKAKGPTGGIAVWQDGTVILKADDVATIQSDLTEWMVGGASDGISPGQGSVYVDDATISLTRVGPGG